MPDTLDVAAPPTDLAGTISRARTRERAEVGSGCVQVICKGSSVTESVTELAPSPDISDSSDTQNITLTCASSLCGCARAIYGSRG
jgi:hypothetical protein